MQTIPSVIEFQQRAGERCTLAVLVIDGPAPLDDGTMVKILRDLAQKRGVWKNVREPGGIRISCLKHTRTSTDMFAGAIIGAIRAVKL